MELPAFLKKKPRKLKFIQFQGAFDLGLDGNYRSRTNPLQPLFRAVETIPHDGKHIVFQHASNDGIGLNDVWVAGFSHSKTPLEYSDGKKFFLLNPIRGRALRRQVKNAVLEHFNAKKQIGLLDKNARVGINFL
ncbi:hypothetical protein HY993_05015 [Candidatus Micrarchaeota archaeon]|nr:hypothetical protein [Candidatus Micrarchaeota archaeon]